MVAAAVQKLTYEQKALVRLAGDPLALARVHPRAAGFPSGPPEESPLLFSLIDDPSFAPPDKSLEIIADFSGGFNALDDTFGLEENLGAGLGSDVKRNFLRDFLKSQARNDFENSYFAFQKIFLPAVADFAGIENTNFQPFRRDNILSCYKAFQYGQVESLAFPNSDPVQKVLKKNCGNKYCPWCGSRRRKRLAAEYMAVVDDCVELHGLKKTWSLVFTLPENRERMLHEDAVKMRPVIAKIVRKAFGCKTRDNIGMAITIHPVGSSDIMRPRVHFHVLVIPLVFDKSGVSSSRDVFILSPSALQSAWKEALGGVDEVIPPEVSFFQVSTATGSAQFAKRLEYDFRSFSIDFDNAVLLSSRFAGDVILKCSRSGSIFWRCLPIEDIASQWCRAVDLNRVQPYGWLQKVEKYRELGAFPPLPVADPGVVVASVPCVIQFVREKIWDIKKKKMVWVRVEFCHFEGKHLKIGPDISWR